MILTLLKWLGILLLVLFLLAFFLILIVLCVPVRYHVQAVFGEKTRVCGYGSFFLHLVHVSFRIEGGEQRHVIRILGIPLKEGGSREKGSRGKRKLMRRKKRSRKSAKNDRTASQRRDGRETGEPVQNEGTALKGREGKETGKSVQNEETALKERGGRKKETEQLQRIDQKTGSVQVREDQPEEIKVTEWIESRDRRKDARQTEGRQAEMAESFSEESERIHTEESSEERKGFCRKIFERIRQFLLSIRERFVRIYKRLRRRLVSIWAGAGDFHQKASVTWDILVDDNTPQLWKLVWQSVQFLLRHCKPRRIQGSLVFGTGDPCTTGQILGAIGMCYALVGSGVEITPDFERPVLDGKLGIWGRVRIGVVVYLVGRLWFSGEWKHFKRQMELL